MNKGSVLYCDLGHRIGMAPAKVLWTGSLKRTPPEPDGLHYSWCRHCKKWQRFEIVPPEIPEINIDKSAA